MNKIDEKELSELFIELKHNNKIAFEKLYSKYNKLIYSIAFSILKNKTDSEDIVQTVFTKLYTMSKDKLPIQKQASWLYSLTKNETISFLRKKKHNIDLESIYEIEDRDNEINNIIDQIEFNRLIITKHTKQEKPLGKKNANTGRSPPLPSARKRRKSQKGVKKAQKEVKLPSRNPFKKTQNLET